MDKLQLLLPSLTDYLRHEIYEFRSFFTEAFRGKSFTLDYCATSLAESAMIVRYLSGEIVSLADIRIAVTRAYQVKSRGIAMAVECQFRLIHPTESEYGLKQQTLILR
jgi:hypothetical protein